MGKALRLTQEQQPSQWGQGTQSWDRAILGLQLQSSWGWDRSDSGKDNQDFPRCQLKSDSPKSSGTVNRRSSCKSVADKEEMSNTQAGFVEAECVTQPHFPTRMQ